MIRSAPSLVGIALISATAFAQVPPDSEVRKILADRVREGSGIVAGIVDANGRRIVSQGKPGANDTRPLDGDTVFEIGSLTKVFTALLLMDMVRRGEVALTDPVSKYLPPGVKMPERKGREITLADLATHTSGLPSLPSNIHPKDESNPFADYPLRAMYDFLSGYQLTRDVGSSYEYSHLGMGLLGHVLALRAGTSYEELVRSRICDPLGMSSTRITLTPEMKARLAVGHDAAVRPVANWEMPALLGTGGLRSTANDLTTFLAAFLGRAKTPLSGAIADQVSAPRPDMQSAFGWRVDSKDGILWQDGGTGGYASYMGFDPKARSAVVVLTNVATDAGPDDIGRHLLDPAVPLATAARPRIDRKRIALDPALFDRYVGTYRLEPYVLIAISRDAARFYVQLTGYPRVEMFAESDREFVLENASMRFTFDTAATRLTVHEFGIDRVAKRLTEAEAARARAAIETHEADIAKRYKHQTRAPGTEAALRRSIHELQAGEPDYARMNPLLALVIQKQLPQWKAAIDGYGALRSVKFKGVEPTGADIYQVKFEHANTEWRVALGGDGKLQGLIFHSL